MSDFEFDVILVTRDYGNKPVGLEENIRKLLEDAGYAVGDVEDEGV